MKKQLQNKANGFSLVEVVIAMLILTVGLLALASSTGYISAEIRNSTWATQRAFARNEIVERLRAIPFDSVATTATPTAVGRYNMTWTSTSVNNNLKSVLVIASGPSYRMGNGARITVVDTTSINIIRP
jgi:prepilin-type N-terminal cleavage/methylation domain-containing protein